MKSLALKLPIASFGQPEQPSLPEHENLESQHSPIDPDLELRPHTSIQPLESASSTQTQLPHVVPTHPMVTCSQHIITKPNPKYALITMLSLDIPCNPYNICSALAHPGWKAARCEELEALHKNKTWELVLRTRDLHVNGSKWVFK